VAGPARARALLVLGHGAGGGIEAPDLAALAAALPSAGYAVARVEQPYRVAGRRTAAPAAQLDAAFLAVVGAVRTEVPVVVGGRSSGARVACRTAAVAGAAAVLGLAFPLHPPGRPERTRLPELAAVAVPLLIVQGERDAFGRPGEFPADVPLVAVPGADHALRRPEAVVNAVLEWLPTFGNR
jgi:predicted alpha/beta-hydrolase family hydrolase